MKAHPPQGHRADLGFSIHTDAALAAARRDAFGWSVRDDTLFTMVQSGEHAKHIELVFDAAKSLSVDN